MCYATTQVPWNESVRSATQRSEHHGSCRHGSGVGIADDGNINNSKNTEHGPDEIVGVEEEHEEEKTAGHDEDSDNAHIVDNNYRIDFEQDLGAGCLTPTNTGTRAQSLAVAYTKLGSFWNRLAKGLEFRRHHSLGKNGNEMT